LETTRFKIFYVSYQAHLPRALATIARFGGRVIAGGGKIDLLEGDPT